MFFIRCGLAGIHRLKILRETSATLDGPSVEKCVPCFCTLYIESFKSNGTHVMATFLRKDIEAAVRKSSNYDEEVSPQ